MRMGQSDGSVNAMLRRRAIALSATEESAIYTAFDVLIPPEAAEWRWHPVRHATAIHDRELLEQATGVPTSEFVNANTSLEQHGGTIVCPAATLAIIRAACHHHPAAILGAVLTEEQEIRERCELGTSQRNPLDHRIYSTSPALEYERYRNERKPVHDLLRHWCGKPAVELHTQLVARVLTLLPQLHALGVTQGGHPPHPLYLRADTPLVEWTT